MRQQKDKNKVISIQIHHINNSNKLLLNNLLLNILYRLKGRNHNVFK